MFELLFIAAVGYGIYWWKKQRRASAAAAAPGQILPDRTSHGPGSLTGRMRAMSEQALAEVNAGLSPQFQSNELAMQSADLLAALRLAYGPNVSDAELISGLSGRNADYVYDAAARIVMQAERPDEKQALIILKHVNTTRDAVFICNTVLATLKAKGSGTTGKFYRPS